MTQENLKEKLAPGPLIGPHSVSTQGGFLSQLLGSGVCRDDVGCPTGPGGSSSTQQCDLYYGIIQKQLLIAH